MTKMNAMMLSWDRGNMKDETYDKYFVRGGGAVEDDEGGESTPPKWTSVTIAAFTLAVVLTSGWFAVYVKKNYEEYKERKEREAAGIPEDPDEDELIGGMAKAKHMKEIMDKVESLEVGPERRQHSTHTRRRARFTTPAP